MKQTADDEKTGLPGLGSWPRVYAVVLAVLAAWVVVLAVLERMFP
jgi:hypothetical protein